MDDISASRLVRQYSDMLMRVAFSFLKNKYDAQDICQSVFLKYLTQDSCFEHEEHEKAWLIRTTINLCKNHLGSGWKRKTVYTEPEEGPDSSFTEALELKDMLSKLSENERIAIYLHYYEGYSAGEIGDLLGKSPNAVLLMLSRGRRKLRRMLTYDFPKTLHKEKGIDQNGQPFDFTTYDTPPMPCGFLLKDGHVITSIMNGGYDGYQGGR